MSTQNPNDERILDNALDAEVTELGEAELEGAAGGWFWGRVGGVMLKYKCNACGKEWTRYANEASSQCIDWNCRSTNITSFRLN